MSVPRPAYSKTIRRTRSGLTRRLLEFDPNNPDVPTNKFEAVQFGIPPGPSGAKARFYFWATALARRGSGENQFYTALALHELFDANSNVLSKDELVREQALKAYRSRCSTTFSARLPCFTCCPAASPEGIPVAFSVPLNELTADNLYRTDATGFLRLIEGDPILVLETLLGTGGSPISRPIRPTSTTVSSQSTTGSVAEDPRAEGLSPRRVVCWSVASFLASAFAMAEPMPVILKKSGTGWQLLRGGRAVFHPRRRRDAFAI